MVLCLGATVLALEFGPGFATSAARAAAALAPLQRIRATDELRQRIEFEACMITFAVGVPLLPAVGLLDNAGIVHVGMFMAAPVVLAIYVPAQLFAHWRHR